MHKPGTYQTRISGYGCRNRESGDAALAAYAELYSRVQRKLFADVAAGRPAVSLKSAYLERYGIPARMFNGIRVSLDGKVASVREQQKLRGDDLRRRISRAERQISDASEDGRWQQVHQKRRRLGNLKSRVAALEDDMAAGRVRLCFGSKRLWRKQHDLEANGYGSHEEWLRDWRDARSGEFFVMGSRDETGGCQLCVATIADDGTLTLRLRMPDCLAEQLGKYLVIERVKFAYGHEQMLAALEANAEYGAYRGRQGEKAARATCLGQAISYRFKRDDKGWRDLRHHRYGGSAGGYRPKARRHRRGPERRPSGRCGDRCLRQLAAFLAGAPDYLWEVGWAGRGYHRRCGCRRGVLRQGSGQAHRH